MVEAAESASLVTSILNLTPALIGLTGVLLGIAATWASSARVQRTQFNVARMTEDKAYLARALQAADNLWLVHAIDLEAINRFIKTGQVELAAGRPFDPHYMRSDELVARITRATEEWRSVLTMRYLSAGFDVDRELVALDDVRARAAEAVDAPDLEAAARILDGEMAQRLRLLKLAVGVEGARMNVILERSLRPWRWARGDRVFVASGYDLARRQYDDARADLTAEQ